MTSERGGRGEQPRRWSCLTLRHDPLVLVGRRAEEDSSPHHDGHRPCAKPDVAVPPLLVPAVTGLLGRHEARADAVGGGGAASGEAASFGGGGVEADARGGTDEGEGEDREGRPGKTQEGQRVGGGGGRDDTHRRRRGGGGVEGQQDQPQQDIFGGGILLDDGHFRVFGTASAADRFRE